MENREFRLHKDILWSVIQAQAGTLSKAILELVMNSVDAGAATVGITIDAGHFTVTDDGKGFTRREEIEDFFETFGTPHQTGDAVYGRFRMGRGQIMAFSQNTWESGPFRMEVDIKNKGLNYVLSTLPNPVRGCHISGSLYERLRPSELINTEREIADLCKYAPLPVMLNGRRVSRDLSQEAWTLEDDDAYYRLKADAGWLEVYNLGVLVRAYAGSNLGCGGEIISKRQLEVNFARNDILANKCEVWKRIAAKVREYAKKFESKQPVKNENYRCLLARQMISGDFETTDECWNAFNSEKCFTDIRGRHLSLDMLARAVPNSYGKKLCISPEKGNMKADKLHTERLAFVLDPKTLERFGVESLTALLQRLKEGLKLARHLLPDWRYNHIDKQLNSLRSCATTLEEAGAALSESHFLVEPKKWTREEKRIVAAIEAAQWCLLAGFSALGMKRSARALRIGKSDTAQMWTDGESFICINRELLKIQGFPGSAMRTFTRLGAILCHEYLHSDPDGTTHTHDAEFYEAYESLMGDTDALGDFISSALSHWLALIRQDEKARLRQGERHEMDRQQELQERAQALAA